MLCCQTSNGILLSPTGTLTVSLFQLLPCFILNRGLVSKVKYAVNDFVLVNNGEIDKGNEGDENAGFWPAKILEIRALDQAHVYARVYWLYWPDDLPSGRENFHGESEVIASNHMDVIDVTTVSEKIQVLHYLESDNIAPPAKGYYWRQTFNPYSGRLSVSCSDQLQYDGYLKHGAVS